MFRKAQMKIFAIITCILLAVFIAVLGSINIIMNAVMEKQSRDVLKQIAEGVEYDTATGTFSFVRPAEFKEPQHGEPPPKPSAATTTPTTSSEKSTSETSATTTSMTASKTTSSASGVTTTVSLTGEDEQSAVTKTNTAATEALPANGTVRTSSTAATTKTVTQPTSTVYTSKGEKVTTAAQTTSVGKTSAVSTRPANTSKPAATTQVTSETASEAEVPTETMTTLPPDIGEDTTGFPFDRPPFPEDWGYDPNRPFRPPNYDDPWHNNDPNGEQTTDENDRWHRPFGGGERQENLGFSSNDEEEGGIKALGNIENEAPKKNGRPSERPDAEPVPKSLGTIEFFILMSDESGNYLASLNNDEIGEGTAQNYITEIIKADTETGRLNNYQFYRMNKDNGKLIVFTDKSAEIDMLSKLIRTTITIGIASFLILSAAAFFLSVQIVKPLKSAFEKQKQFVSDASHELKTPVTVISANADVLADEIGENKWLDYIKSQTDRMNVLVNDLLNLTRLENNTTDFIKLDFDMSKAVINTALPFECQAFETNKKFIVDVDDNITVNGSEKHIKQMTAIFIDNALKYSNDGGTVRVSLKKAGDKKILSVFNTGSGVKASEQDKIFERFYRSDESRNRSTGGYGLGLAIAKSIIDRHKFKVTVENNEGENICFIITM